MDVYASIPKELKQSGAIKELQALFLNLACGMKLLMFRRNIIYQITVSYDQFILLLGFYGLTALVASFGRPDSKRIAPNAKRGGKRNSDGSVYTKASSKRTAFSRYAMA